MEYKWFYICTPIAVWDNALENLEIYSVIETYEIYL